MLVAIEASSPRKQPKSILLSSQKSSTEGTVRVLLQLSNYSLRKPVNLSSIFFPMLGGMERVFYFMFMGERKASSFVNRVGIDVWMYLWMVPR